MTMSTPNRRARCCVVAQRGFTLIEILVTFAVMAILLGLAAPSFIAFQRNSELTSTANSFLSALSVARAEAMKRQLNALVVPIRDNDWSGGWRVYVDVNGNSSYEASADILVTEQRELPATVLPSIGPGADGFSDGSHLYAMFVGSGFMRLANGSFKSSALDFKSSYTDERRRIIANPAGRLRVCNPGNASHPADPGCNATDPI